MYNGAKLAVASVARATPLFLPRPEIIYINVLHYSAPPRTYLLRATPPLCPNWRHWRCQKPVVHYLIGFSNHRILYFKFLLSFYLKSLSPICSCLQHCPSWSWLSMKRSRKQLSLPHFAWLFFKLNTLLQLTSQCLFLLTHPSRYLDALL